MVTPLTPLWLVDCIHLIGFVFNFSGSNLCAGLSCLGLLLSCLGLFGVVLVVGTCCTSVVSVIPVCISPRFEPTSGIKARVQWYGGVV
jgi:hypothetical protein